MNWIGMLIGGAVGAAFGFLTRCQGNTCPLTSKWWVPIIIGAVLGLMWKK